MCSHTICPYIHHSKAFAFANRFVALSLKGRHEALSNYRLLSLQTRAKFARDAGPIRINCLWWYRRTNNYMIDRCRFVVRLLVCPASHGGLKRQDVGRIQRTMPTSADCYRAQCNMTRIPFWLRLPCNSHRPDYLLIPWLDLNRPVWLVIPLTGESPSTWPPWCLIHSYSFYNAIADLFVCYQPKTHRRPPSARFAYLRQTSETWGGGLRDSWCPDLIYDVPEAWRADGPGSVSGRWCTIDWKTGQGSLNLDMVVLANQQAGIFWHWSCKSSATCYGR